MQGCEWLWQLKQPMIEGSALVAVPVLALVAGE